MFTISPPPTGSYSKPFESSLHLHTTLGSGHPKWHFPSKFPDSNFVCICISHTPLLDFVTNHEPCTSSCHFYNYTGWPGYCPVYHKCQLLPQPWDQLTLSQVFCGFHLIHVTNIRWHPWWSQIMEVTNYTTTNVFQTTTTNLLWKHSWITQQIRGGQICDLQQSE
jgi:hypothetical protein